MAAFELDTPAKDRNTAKIWAFLTAPIRTSMIAITAFDWTEAVLLTEHLIVKHVGVAMLRTSMAALRKLMAAHLLAATSRRMAKKIIWLCDLHNLLGMTRTAQLELVAYIIIKTKQFKDLAPNLHCASRSSVADDVHPIFGTGE
jgi:hypothetical protein